MPSIILSFVGQQDPVSDTTHEDGSIVSLTRHLVAGGQPIKQVLLLYTAATWERAELTKGWLMDAPFHLPEATIQLFPAGDQLSEDPVNLLMAVMAARQGLAKAIAHKTDQDILEFNASSGTPVMKSAWNLLQAAGYAPNSRVWQVRNPQEQQPHQARVFQTNVQVLRQELDARVIRQQLQNYDYSGALATLKASGLSTPFLRAFLRYGHCRRSLDFRRAQAAIAPILSATHTRWQSEIEILLRKNQKALLQEAYFNAVVELKTEQYSNFLVRVFQFQEQASKLLVTYFLKQQPSLPRSFEEIQNFWKDLRHLRPDLARFLSAYQYKNYPLRLDGYPNRPVMLAILTYAESPSLEALQALNTYCEQRNQYIHYFEGVSELEGVTDVLRAMRQVLENLGQTDFTNPFNLLNEEIWRSLNSILIPLQ